LSQAAKRNENASQSYTPGPGYYGISRNPYFADTYKSSFADLYKEPTEAKEFHVARLKGPVLKFSKRTETKPLEVG
jgi:hypothetical protein